MKIFRLKSPERIFITYNGSIEDTAAVVGLYNLREKVDQIIFTGSQSVENRERILQLNQWLNEKNWPLICFNEGDFNCQLVELKSKNPLKDWNWAVEECICLLKLAGFKL